MSLIGRGTLIWENDGQKNDDREKDGEWKQNLIELVRRREKKKI